MSQRLAWVRAFRGALVAHQEALLRLIEAETAKPRHEALLGDLMPLLASCRWHERHAGRVLRERAVGGRPLLFVGMRHRVRRVPLGRVAIIATWNYPVQLLGIQLVQALVAGNRVVVKPSEHAPRTQALLLELAVAAGLPAGTLEWTGAGRDEGPRLLEAGGLDHVVFTGSTAVGRQVAAWAAEHLIPTTLELSGCDSAIVLDDADAALAASSIWTGVTMNGGQTCMAPRRALVDQRVYHRFIAALAPLAAGAAPRALISAPAALAAFELARRAVDAGARSLSGVLEAPRGSAMVPLAIADCPEDAPLVAGDHFAPVLAVVPVRGLEHALRVHAACGQHLATSIFTRDTRRAGAIAPRLGAGYVTINDCVLPQAHPGTSIGGVGRSGWGASRGEAGLRAMTREVCVAATSPRFRAPAEPPTRRSLAMLAGLITAVYRPRFGRVPPAAVRAGGPKLVAEPVPDQVLSR